MRITPAERAFIISFLPLFALTACVLPFSKRAHRSTATEQMTNGSSSLQDILNHIGKNPLFTTKNLTMRHQNCSFGDYSNPQEYSSEIRSYVQDETHCLNQSWGPVLTAAGFSGANPKIEIVTSYPYKTECWDSPVSDPTYECMKTIYIQVNDDKFRDGEDGGVDSGSGFYNINTSYTAWVILESGLGGMEHEAESQFGTATEQGGEIHRRRLSEIICLSGIYLGSQYKNDTEEADFYNYIYNNEDDIVAQANKAGTNTEPSGQHQLDWFRTGVDSGGRPSACNTWKAPASEVS